MRRLKLFSSISEAEQKLPLGKPKRLVISGKSLCIVRDHFGIHVTGGLCPHQRASLHEGFVNAFNEIICPLHEYRFNLSTGRESDNRTEDLEVFTVEVGTDGVYLEH